MANDLDNNRLKRIMVLDAMLSSEKGGVTMTQILEKVKDSTSVESDRFAIKRDLKFLEDMGYSVEQKKKTFIDPKNHQARSTTYMRYTDPDKSLFRIDLSEDEKKFLADALAMLGLKGLSSMKSFRRISFKPRNKPGQQIISFTKNPIEKQVSKQFENILEAIRFNEIIKIGVHDRKPPYKTENHTVHPWYLREYNRRWYLFGFDENEQRVMRYALDRIDKKPQVIEAKFQTQGGKAKPGRNNLPEYRRPTMTIEEILHDVVGVSIEEGDILDILFWVSDESADYISKKHIHHSQKESTQEEAENILGHSLDYEGGKYFKISCKENYELRRELLSFGSALVVLSPQNLRTSLRSQLIEMLKMYES